MERSWMTTGEELVERLGRESVEQEIDGMEWQEIPEEGSLTTGFMQGAAVNAVIRELRIPKVSAVAFSSFDRPSTSEREDGFYPGFYGIEGNYANGRARVYVLDVGTYVQPLVSDFWPKVAEGSDRTDSVLTRCFICGEEIEDDADATGISATKDAHIACVAAEATV